MPAESADDQTGRNAPFARPAGGEPYLLTPGPLTTSIRTKRAMLRDWGSRDDVFRDITADIRRRLVAMADGGEDFDCVPMQGSGTFAVEAALSSFIPRDGKALVLINGAYGERAARILDCLGRDHVTHHTGEYEPPAPCDIDRILAGDGAITDIFVVHCETSSGVLNPVKEIADIVAARGRRLIIDSMSAFGAIPLDAREVAFDVMVSSANKCIEGVPGFGFIIARKDAMERAAGNSHSLSLDVHDQWVYMNKTRQWRFTPPTHAVAAFREALLQHEEEGGVAGRNARYRRSHRVLVSGMRSMGFETLLTDGQMAPVITTFYSPADPAFDFDRFYDELAARGYVIYPGKLTEAATFRLGCIGYLDEHVMQGLIDAMAGVLAVMGVSDCSAARRRAAGAAG